MKRSRFRIAASSLAVLLSVPISAQVTERVSVNSSGVQGDSWSFGPRIVGNGRFVMFASQADNLVSGDTNQVIDVFIRDRWLGTTERLSLATDGGQGDDDSGQLSGISYFVDISATPDARYVAFASEASNFIPGNASSADVFVRDRVLNTTECVSLNLAGHPGSGQSGAFGVTISADGRYVAFDTTSSSLVAGSSFVSDVVVHDRQAGTTELVSVGWNGAPANAGSGYCVMSGDGRYVAFESDATNLIASGDTNGVTDIYVRDRQNHTNERVSVGSSGVEANDTSLSWSPGISSDGRYVVFASSATNLVPGDTNGSDDIFVRDRLNGTTERVSVSSTGAQADTGAAVPAISADGRFVAFQSGATNLVPGPTNGAVHTYLRDRLLGTTERVSVDSSGNQGNGQGTNYEYGPSVSEDGRYVGFSSVSTNLVAGDTNVSADAFIRDRAATAFTSVCHPGLDGVIACPCANPPSAVGRGCNNSSSTGGAILSASGVSYLSMDNLVFTTSGEKPTALSVFSQGTVQLTAGIAFGQGVRCANQNLKRLYTKTAVGGIASAPVGGDQPVHTRSAALGDPIAAGASRYYYVYYRDPTVLGGCSTASTFNTTQTGRIDWSL